jgi:hypothetical protein
MAWTKVLPPHFLAARETALIRAHQYEEDNGIISSPSLLLLQQQQYPMMPPEQSYMDSDPAFYPDNHPMPYDSHASTNNVRHGSAATAHNHQYVPVYGTKQQQHQFGPQARDMSSQNTYTAGSVRGHSQQEYQNNTIDSMYSPNMMQPADHTFLRNVAEEGAFMDGPVPIDEAIAAHAGVYQRSMRPPIGINSSSGNSGGIDPPEDEPPSLRKRGGYDTGAISVSSAEPSMNSPHYESSPHNDPASPTFEPSPSDYDEAIRYSNDEFQNDPDQYYQMDGAHNQYDHRETQQQHYNLHDGYDENQPSDYPRSPDFMPEENFEEQDDYQYENKKTSFGVEYDADEFQPNEDDRNNPYRPEDEEYFDDNIDHFVDISPQPSGVPFSDPGNDIDYDDNGFPVEKEQATSPTSGSEYSAPTMNDDGFSNGLLYMSTSTDDNIQAPLETTKRNNTSSQPQQSSTIHHFPPVSPRSGHGSEYSQSSAMRGAQELLRRNRQKRLELAMRMKQQVRQYKGDDEDNNNNNDIPADENLQSGGVSHHMINTNDVISPQSQDSGSTWQTGASEYTGSEVTGGSSIWTETEMNPDRSSRRALILQMARARMKNQGGSGSAAAKQHASDSDGLMNTALEEKKLEHIHESAEELDFNVDLD